MASEQLGVNTVALPAKGNQTPPAGRSKSARAFNSWSSGEQVRRTNSSLKRDFGWNRTLIDGIHGARTWCGHGVFNHNLVKIGSLLG
jgi:IS5 family transposase